nr:unnamed protein product [Digitaria exilis]
MDASHPEGEAAAGTWVTVEEWSGSSATALSRTAVLTASASSLTSHRFGSRWGRIGGRMLGAFVPEGFPGSVTPDYVPFQMWDTLQGLSTYIRTMLSTQALLGAIGVGEQSATVIGATFQVDFSTSLQMFMVSEGFDRNAWRDIVHLLSGILLNIGSDNTLCGQHVIVYIHFMCILFHQGSNLDSNAKMWRLVADFMNDLGMLMDLLSPLFPSSLIVIMCLGSLSRSFTGVASGATRAALTQHFALANNAADISAKEGSQETLATMLANYKAVQSLSLTTLNYERASILLQHFKECGEDSLTLVTFGRLEIAKTRSHYENTDYLLLDKEGSVHIFIHKQATPADVLKSFVHGLVLAHSAHNGKSKHADARQWMDEKYATFISRLQMKGYSTERLLSHSIIWRAHWLHGQLDEKLK